ncbi:uncharacterized protein LOC111193301 [Astyanax mexicanus]|uniref:uncharacterized protein LOC111193301 n=1 Tax=Astyanax mexicanus TaxID=7994 RepID=UPI0020CAEE49|nr:uncharacterized protein LOC111193301 [Astyanax mexicanus]
MAEELFGKTVDELKRWRTVAKSALTKQANFLSRGGHNLTESELREEFKKLDDAARKVWETNDDYRAGLLAEKEAKAEFGEQVTLEEQIENDIENTVQECKSRLDEGRKIVQTYLWSKYGEAQLLTAIQEAEKACDDATAIPANGTNCDGYDVQLDIVDKLIIEATKALSNWEQWIPEADKVSLGNSVKSFKVIGNRLQARRVEFVTARRIAEEEKAATVLRASVMPAMPVIKLKPTSLPRFYGNRRDFHHWKKDWESLQKQGEPTGSAEVKKIQLLDSLDDKIIRDLRLSTYNTAGDILRVLENRYGNKSSIAMEIVESLEKIPAVQESQPRKVIDLIRTVEKALVDLTELEDTGAIKNPLVIKSIESKLPDSVKKDWLIFMVNPSNGVKPDNHFDNLLKFLKTQEEVFERLEQLGVTEKLERPDKLNRKLEKKYASTKNTKKDESEDGCSICGADGHKNKVYFCKKFRRLRLSEKKDAVKKLGACRKCLGCHETDDGCKDTFLCKNKDCRKGSCSDHHFFLCPKAEEKRAKDGNGTRTCERKVRLTEEQERFLAELPPEMAEKCKKAFTNKTSMTDCSNQIGLVKENGLQELPVIMMLLEVTANAGQRIGTLIDLASDTNYITHEAADRLRLRGEEVTLVVHGVGGMTMQERTKRYLLRVRVKTPKGTEIAHEMICYGLDEIAKVHRGVTPMQLKRFFPEAELEELKRPEEIELLISHREGKLAPQRVKIVGDLVLWESPLGKIVGGAHPDLFEEIEVAAHESKTHFARSMRTAAVKYEEKVIQPKEEVIWLSQKAMATTVSTAVGSREFLEWWRWDSIGAACEPKCGGCRCGTCQPGGKEMTLAEERELEVIKEGLTYIKKDAHSKTPHWDAKYPWTEDPASLPNNRRGVEATFLRTERQLIKTPEWKAAYTAQVRDMVERGAAKKLTTEISSWKGPVWYVSHLVAPNPHSVTTPVRLVWNSSQKFEGLSMNDLLLKGPDVLNPIRAVLLRFRNGVHAALGDITKMYNSVWLEEREMHLHRFLWRDSPEEDLSEYAITRVNIGDRPAGCIAQLAMRETARLPEFTDLKEARRVLEEDSYVDDILTSHNSKDILDKIVAMGSVRAK